MNGKLIWTLIGTGVGDGWRRKIETITYERNTLYPAQFLDFFSIHSNIYFTKQIMTMD